MRLSMGIRKHQSKIDNELTFLKIISGKGGFFG